MSLNRAAPVKGRLFFLLLAGAIEARDQPNVVSFLKHYRDGVGVGRAAGLLLDTGYLGYSTLDGVAPVGIFVYRGDIDMVRPRARGQAARRARRVALPFF
jgi:hypothetical protein